MHHALLLLGTYEWGISRLPEVSRTEGPDTIHLRGTRMGIDDVRKLIEAAYRTPIMEESRHFVISFADLTVEAQNALLKILEEPPATSRFYIITEKQEGLLPTLRSRLLIFDTETNADKNLNWESFLKSSYAERLSEIADHATKKDDLWLEDIFNGMELYAEEKRDLALMRGIEDFQRVFNTSGASKKMILEHLALMLPLS